MRLPQGQFERWSQLTFEIEFDLATEQTKRDLLDSANVEVIAIASNGEKIVLPAFTNQKDEARGLWHCRFTPREVGSYTAYALLNGESKAESVPVAFNVVEGSRKRGFLRANQKMPYFMRFDNQELFRGIGLNIGWEPRRRRHAEHTYDVLFPKLSDQGMNTVRTWMCPWNMPLEWDRELGDHNQDSLRRLDELLELAELNGIYINLVLGYHGELQTVSGSFPGNDRWKENPYNSKNGGPCNTPEEFFTNKEAITLYKRKLRHLVARIASHPHLLAWEFWNEVDHIQNRGPVSGAALVAWHKEMAEYLHEIDPYGHPITTSISVKAPDGLWEIDDIDLVMLHPYGKTDGLVKLLRQTNSKFGKPAVAGEFSYSWKSGDRSQAQKFKRELHLGLWRGMMSPTPILPLTWWWEFHDSQGDWKLYKPVAKFLACMTESNSKDWSDIAITASQESIESQCIRINGSLFVWVHNKGSLKAAESSIYFHEVPSGDYTMRLFDTLSGEFRELEQVQLEESNGTSSLSLPSIDPGQDMALIIER
ncbi:cellulase family glycosylhydrolase [Bythopirellula goksoeyrii]|uniref:cellulase family glycosylhydrolase n=1 Tax=Bythopirellula goksoeyrii TaxID=1400387 RepID=UPI00143D6254|nr:cellulase family glycosylhydrolase [Bythopirellula goksoeyrii]